MSAFVPSLSVDGSYSDRYCEHCHEPIVDDYDGLKCPICGTEYFMTYSNNTVKQR